ncbi:MAG: Spy/CpxP family protein refolding chaperone [Leptospiraceae bacterium]|nr:Spy/CpxP family protein refolding chaperone [Leptospiraceae bacterium]
MKTKTIKHLIIAASLVWVWSAGSLMAKPQGPKGDPAKRLEQMSKVLKLTADQQTKMKAVFDKYAPKHKALGEQLKSRHEAMRKYITADKASRSEVKTSLEAIAQLKVEKGLLRYDQGQEMKAILTPAQRQQWKDMMQKRMDHMRDRRKGDFKKGPRPGKTNQ